MSFWETKAGHDLTEMLQYYLHKQMKKKQYTKVIRNDEVAEFIESAVKEGDNFVSTIPYNTYKTLVVMEKH